MNNQLSQPTEEGEKMTTTGFRILPSELARAKDKAGIVTLSKYVRTLFLMWLNGEIEVTENDIKKYNPK